MYGDIYRWAEKLPVAELFDLDDVQRVFPDRSRNAIKMALARLCRDGDDPIIARICRGVYCRRVLGIKAPFPHQAYEGLMWRVAGTGAGLTGPSIINRLTWTTQFPMQVWVSVVGRPPQIPALSRVVFVSRSNRTRLRLNRAEVSFLEAVRSFDDWAEMSWDEALADLNKAKSLGYYKPNARRDMLLKAVECERGVDPQFKSRSKELAEIVCLPETETLL